MKLDLFNSYGSYFAPYIKFSLYENETRQVFHINNYLKLHSKTLITI